MLGFINIVYWHADGYSNQGTKTITIKSHI